MNGESSPGIGGTQENGAHFSQSIPTPAAYAILEAMLADECADHAALIDAVRRCRVLPMAGGVFLGKADWERVMQAIERQSGYADFHALSPA